MANTGKPVREWYKKCKDVDGILSDINGVLYDEKGQDGAQVIEGSIEAVNKLTAAGIPLRFCTNETTCSQADIAEKLNGLGFSVNPEHITSPVPTTSAVLKKRSLRPFLVVHDDIQADFKDIDQNDPNCVVLGFTRPGYSYDRINRAFQILMSLKEPVLLAMSKSKFYKNDGQLSLDVGTYTKTLEYACNVTAEVMGKPSPAFFQRALDTMGVPAGRAIMIGDDIETDVGGSQACGLMGIQVRTGKYQPSHEPHPVVSPDGYVDNLNQFADMFIQNKYC